MHTEVSPATAQGFAGILSILPLEDGATLHIVAPVTNPTDPWMWSSRFTEPQAGWREMVELLPYGNSPVSDVYYTFWTWTDDGDRYEWTGSYIDSEDELFLPYAHGGYTQMYLTDGDYTCNECAHKHWIETGERFRPFTDADWGDTSTGMDCGHCGKTIVEPHCAECQSEDYTGPWFNEVSGESMVCGHCMAEYVVKGEVEKTALLTYRGITRYNRSEYRCEWTNDGRSVWALNNGGTQA